MAEIVRFKDNEKLIDMDIPKGAGITEGVMLAEQTLTDESKVYAILVGNVRISCSEKKEADDLFWRLTMSGRYDVEVGIG